MVWTGGRAGVGIRGNRMQLTTDKFETITELDDFTHYNSWQYVPQLDIL